MITLQPEKEIKTDESDNSVSPKIEPVDVVKITLSGVEGEPVVLKPEGYLAKDVVKIDYGDGTWVDKFKPRPVYFESGTYKMKIYTTLKEQPFEHEVLIEPKAYRQIIEIGELEESKYVGKSGTSIRYDVQNPNQEIILLRPKILAVDDLGRRLNWYIYTSSMPKFTKETASVLSSISIVDTPNKTVNIKLFVYNYAR